MSMPDFGALRTDGLSPRVQRSATHVEVFAQTVREGLSKPGQKELPSIYLYDEIGTALFETITLLPEYGLTRADERLLRRYAPTILEHLPPPVVVAELGSGSGGKTRWILEALARREPVVYYPIDMSPSALTKCERTLSSLGSVSVVGLEKSYLEGLSEVASRRRMGETLLVHGANGGVGTAALQIGVAAGAQVFGVVRSEEAGALVHGGNVLHRAFYAERLRDTQHHRVRSRAVGQHAQQRRVQPQSAGPYQSRDRWGLRAAELRARGPIRRGRASHRDAPSLEAETNRKDSGCRLHLHVASR